MRHTGAVGAIPTNHFFPVFNLGYTHESGQWSENAGRVSAVTQQEEVVLPAYLPDTPACRQALAQQYDHIAHNDRIVGKLIEQLQADGLAEETAIFIWSDHGEGLPRRKSWAYFAGSHVPLIINAPGLAPGIEKGVASLIDLGPTVLSMLGMDVPLHMQGRPLLDTSLHPCPNREVVFAHRDRIGESYDRIRSAFDQRFTYVRNSFPHHGRGPLQAYRHRHPIFRELYRLERLGRLSADQRWLFAQSRPVEELYDRENDPDELRNLAADTDYQEVLLKLRAAVTNWEQELGWNAEMDEAQMVRSWYPDNKQPETATPIAAAISPAHDGTDHIEGDLIEAPCPLRLIIQSATQGASVEIALDNAPWILCQSPLRFSKAPINCEHGPFAMATQQVRSAHGPFKSVNN